MKHKMITIIGIILLIIIAVIIVGCNRKVSDKDESPPINEDSLCAKEGAQVFDMEEKGPIKCCAGLILKKCEGVCAPSILGTCISNTTHTCPNQPLNCMPSPDAPPSQSDYCLWVTENCPNTSIYW